MAMKDVSIYTHVAGVPNVAPSVTYSNVDAILHNAALEIVKADDNREVWPVLSNLSLAILRPVGVSPGASSTAGSKRVTVEIGASWTAGVFMTILVPNADDVSFDTSFIVIIDGEKTFIINPILVVSPVLVEHV